MPNLLEGYNISTLAYGITGSGKTYTMLGSGFEHAKESYNISSYRKGILLYALEELFDLLETNFGKNGTIRTPYQVEISYLEVYNERIIDLLRNDEQTNLVILEDPNNGTVIPGLKRCLVYNLEQAMLLIHQGNLRRTMSPTYSNEFSSRSHANIQILVTINKPYDSDSHSSV